MTKINEINAVTTIDDNDCFVLVTFLGTQTAKFTANNLKKWLAKEILGVQQDVTKYLDFPLTGFSYVFQNVTDNLHLIISPAGTLATGTITFPATPIDKQTIAINSTATITALSLVGNGKAISGAVTTLSANGFVKYKFDSLTNKWYRYG